MPESRDPVAPRLDVLGTGLSIAGLSAVVWGLIEAPERGWSEPADPRPFALGAAILAAFIAWQRRTAHPMLDVRVFRNLRFSAASISITFVFFALMGVLYFLTTYMQSVLGYSALRPASDPPRRRRHDRRTSASVALTAVRHEVIVAAGLAPVAAALGVIPTSRSTGYTRRHGVRTHGPRAWASPCRPRPKRSWARCRAPRPAWARP